MESARRTFIGGIGSLSIIGLAGCIKSDNSTKGTSSPNSIPQTTTTPKELKVIDYSFTKVSADTVPDEPAIITNTYDNREGFIEIEGTVRVNNGCMTIELGNPPEQGDFDPLTVKTMIGTRDTGGDMCTQAIEPIGFVLTFDYEGDEVEEVQVEQGGVNSQFYTLTVG